MKKTIYSLGALREALAAVNRRYLEFLSALDDPSGGIGKLGHLSKTIHEDARSYRGFNFFDPRGELLLQVIARGEFNSSGFHNRRLRAFLPGCTSGQVLPLVETAAHARAHQENQSRLQILPHRSGPPSGCLGAAP